MKRVLTITNDGSHTIFVPEMDEHYHSTYGAIQESMHVYIEHGLLKASKKELSVLEVGFGTGLNAYLTYCFAQTRELSLRYRTLERYPLGENEYSHLNYTDYIFPEFAPTFKKMHLAGWNRQIEISQNFKLEKMRCNLLTFQFGEVPLYDLVYYDAFAPGKQPEMWSDEILHKVGASVKKDGILVTYCAKGTVRRALTNAGFMMERIPGPIGKKEILRGKKTF